MRVGKGLAHKSRACQVAVAAGIVADMPQNATTRPLRQFGEKVQELRIAKGMTQAELARRVRLTRQAVSLIERGDMWVKLGTLYQLSLVLGCKPGELL